MKKAFMSVCLLAAMLFVNTTPTIADPIIFHLISSWDTPIPNHGKGPESLPEVSLEGYTLYIDDAMESDFLFIPEGESVVCYTVHVAAAVTQVELPSFLSGAYTVILQRGNLYFEGVVEFAP